MMMAAGKPKSRVKYHGEGEAEANATDCRRLVFSVAHVPDAAAAFFLVSGTRSVVTRSLYKSRYNKGRIATSALSPSWMRENPQLGAEPGD